MIFDYFKLALKNLKHRGLRSWLTILGIFIGIAAVVALISLGAGLREAITGQFGSLSVDKLTIQNKGTGFGPPGSTVVEKLTNHDVKIVENVRGVDLIIPRLIRVVNIEYNKVSNFAYVTDIPSDEKGMNLVYEGFNFGVSEGRLIRKSETGVVLFGSEFAKTKRYDKEIKVGKDINIEGGNFKIIGILKPTSSFQINSVALIPSKDLQDVLKINNEWDLIVAQVHDKNEIEDVATRIKDALRKDRNEKVGEETFSVETPLQALSAVNTILNIINAIVIGIAMISLVVGGVGIANTMYTSVVERTKEIGTMKAIGAQNKDILYIFLIESGLLGLVGAIIGVILGFGFSKTIEYFVKNVYNTNLLQVATPIYLVLGCIVFGFLIGAISGVFPAWRASKINVIDALRYE